MGRIGICVTILLATAAGAFAGPIVPEVEPNNTFATRQMVGAGRGVSGTMTAGNLDFYQFGRTAGQRYGVVVSSGSFDTVIGRFSGAGALQATDDDSGPGLLSAFGANTVGADGQVYVGVTGFSDFGFTGTHPQSGSYVLEVLNQLAQIDGSLTPGIARTYEFSGLLPGSTFMAEITAGTFDTVLGARNSGGTILGTDDDSGAGLLSWLIGTVPANGRLFVTVTGFPDFGLTGAHSQRGAFRLEVFATAVPEPLSVAVFGGLLAAGGLVARRRVQATA